MNIQEMSENQLIEYATRMRRERDEAQHRLSWFTDNLMLRLDPSTGIREGCALGGIRLVVEPDDDRAALAEKLETEMLDRLAEHHLIVNIEHWSSLEAINSIGAPAALEKINAECRAILNHGEGAS